MCARIGSCILLVLILAFASGCASDGSGARDDEPRNDPQQYWNRQPGFTPFSA